MNKISDFIFPQIHLSDNISYLIHWFAPAKSQGMLEEKETYSDLLRTK